MTNGKVAEGVLPPLLSTIREVIPEFTWKITTVMILQLQKHVRHLFQPLFPLRMVTTFVLLVSQEMEELHRVLLIDGGYYEQDPQSYGPDSPIP